MLPARRAAAALSRGGRRRPLSTASPGYMSGFGSHFETEALAGALPSARNSPQVCAHGLYAEQLSGSAFTAPRHQTLRSWLYRIRPSVVHGEFALLDPALGGGGLSAAPQGPVTPNQLRWGPIPAPPAPTDLVGGLFTLCSNGSALSQSGAAVHLFAANACDPDVYHYNADGEMLLVPQEGRLCVRTELGVLDLEPGEVGLIPRGVKFQAELPDGAARGYVLENFGSPLVLPELGPIGANGLANARDFEHPVASFEDVDDDRPRQLVAKFGGQLWAAPLSHSPLDVVAWHGNYAPYKYDLRKFNTINTVSFDHPDPSIFTVLTSPSEIEGVANMDFVIFPSRWMVADGTFRPPYYHRNIMSEYMGLIYGCAAADVLLMCY